jgi:hypothetical protein
MIYLAFLDAYNTPFDPVAHKVNAFFALSGSVIEREDGDIIKPYFTVTIQNPGIAWLASQPSRYAVLSEQADGDEAPVELARGRLSTLPSELAGDDCELEFLCVPPNEDDVLKAAADALRTGEVDYDPDASAEDREAAESYDPLFYSEEATDDPANALAGTMDIWRWNRLTLAAERVHLINGVTQHVIAGATAGVAKSERLSIQNPPKDLTRIRLIAQWTQAAAGDQTSEFIAAQEVTSYSYQGILDSMPKAGDPIGSSSGWTIADVKIHSVASMTPFTFDRPMSSLWGASSQQVTLQPKAITIGMRAHYEYQQPREEIIDLYMSAGVQPVLDDDKVETVEQVTLANLTMDVVTPQWLYEDPETLEVKHYLVGDKVQANGLVWVALVEHDATETFIANILDDDLEVVTALWQKTPKVAAIDARSSKLIGTDRGVRAIRHALRRLNRIVQRRARAAEVQFEVPWSVGRAINCTDECRVENRRWPGGELVGKVTGVELKIEGASRSALITLGVSVGLGEMPADPGEGQSQTANIVYSITAPATIEPVNAFALGGTAPRVLEYENQEPSQRSAAILSDDPIASIAANQTKIRIYFDPIREEDLISRRISVHTTPIFVRKGIDLSPEV